MVDEFAHKGRGEGTLFADMLNWGKEEEELKAMKSLNLYYEGMWTENECRQDKC